MRKLTLVQHSMMFSAAFCLLLSGLFVIPPSALAADPAPVSVDEQVTTGTNYFKYTGTSWRNCPGCYAGAYKNNFKYASVKGDKTVFTFTGTQARLYGFRVADAGIATVSVDGKTAVDLNYYSKTRTLVNIYSTPVLAQGKHTVTLTVSGRKAGGTTTKINIDRAVVYAAAAAPTPPPPAPTTGGVASITLDDGTAGHYTYARPALNQRGLKATFYVVSDAFTWGSTNLNPAQAKQIATEGHEIGNHTRDHSNLTTLTAAQITSEFADAQRSILANTGVTPTSCAYPYGAENSTVQSIAAQYFRSCRGTAGGTNSPSSPAKYNLVNYYISSTTTAAQIRSAADSAKAQGRWIVFTYHGVNLTSTSSEDVSAATFAAHLDALKASGITVKPVSGVL